MDVAIVDGMFAITGPKGTYRIAPSGASLDLTHVGVASAGITDYEALFTALWSLCAAGAVDTITFAWRAGDPYETDTVRQRFGKPSNT